MTDSVQVHDQVLERLIGVAQSKINSVMWATSRPSTNTAIVEMIARRDGDWTEFLPDGLSEEWSGIGDVARIAAFLVAVDYSFAAMSGSVD